MGSWNHTCFLTNLPIRYRDPVVGILIQTNRFLRAHPRLSRNTAFYEFAGLPFRGLYADYGNVDGIQVDLSVKLLLYYFVKKKDSLIIDAEEASAFFEFLDQVDINPGQALATFVDKGVRRGLRIKNSVRSKDGSTPAELNLHLLLMHERVYDKVIQHSTQHLTESLRLKNEEAPAVLLAEHFQNLTSADMRQHVVFGETRFKLDEWEGLAHGNPLLLLDFIFDLVEKVRAQQVTAEELPALWKLYQDHAYFSEFLYDARKIVGPQCGAGSQNDSVASQQFLATLTLDKNNFTRPDLDDEGALEEY